jgi:hypothetical protein
VVQVDSFLRVGIRGLPRCRGLAQVLEEHRGVRNRLRPPRLSLRQILKWADAHHERTGKWPTSHLGRVTESPDETWTGIALSLQRGRRGLPGGSTLTQVLAQHRGQRDVQRRPRLTYRQILAWADDFHQRTGQWPRNPSGPVRQQPDMTWNAVNLALLNAGRGLPGGITLAGMLAKYRGVRARWYGERMQQVRRMLKKRFRERRLSVRQILAWADLHHKRTGSWPTSASGIVQDAPEEGWRRIGLPGGSSIARLLARHRGTLMVIQPASTGPAGS